MTDFTYNIVEFNNYWLVNLPTNLIIEKESLNLTGEIRFEIKIKYHQQPIIIGNKFLTQIGKVKYYQNKRIREYVGSQYDDYYIYLK